MSDNTGHGHVFPRPDGRVARCGGPAVCSECAKDLARKLAAPEAGAAAGAVDGAPRLDGYAADDMEAVGRSLMQAIEAEKSHPFIAAWHPADNPAEIIGDLLNAYDQQAARIRELEEENRRLREALDRYGRHRSFCGLVLSGVDCTCGWFAVRAALTPEAKP